MTKTASQLDSEISRELLLKPGATFDYFGQTFEIVKIARNKERTVQIARRSRDSFGKEHLIDHRSFPARDFDRQNLVPRSR